ncbi:MAG: class I SAM-dependent methyltransferase [Flavobacteriales bacterium]|nr:class I SAM-dependent methyltransferase [Flavobacteriales bacterium]
MKQIHEKCFVCDGKNLKQLGEYYTVHQLVKCRSCGFVFNEKIPTLEVLNKHYAQYSYSSEGYLSPLTIESYSKLLDEFEKFRQTGRILDVGCGRGWFLEEARKRGWEVYGTEYSDKAIEICSAKGIKMLQGEIDSSKFEVKDFDVITSFEVIEHINNPNDDLKEIATLLRTGGLFYCTTPNFNSIMRYYLGTKYNVIDYPEHLSYYSKSTLNYVLKKNGLRRAKFLTTGISITRIKKSKNNSDEKYVSKTSSDEVLREKIATRWYLSVAKSLVNFLLTITSTGMTLKAYYIKK